MVTNRLISKYSIRYRTCANHYPIERNKSECQAKLTRVIIHDSDIESELENTVPIPIPEPRSAAEGSASPSRSALPV